jgi:hypothetical protein
MRALADLDAPVILLKGAAYLLAGLPPSRSHFAYDLDILVPRESLERVEQTLRAAGWRSGDRSPYDDHYYREWMHEIPPLWHPDRRFCVDIHHAILPPTSRYRPDTEALFASSVELDGQLSRVLCPTDMVLHGAAHLFTEEFISGLRQLVLLNDLLEHFAKDGRFWEDLLARSRRHGLERILYYLVRYAGRTLGTPVPIEVARSLETHRPRAVPLAIMDAAVISALRPAALGESLTGRGLALWLLRLRSHWLKMPPALLARHIFAKLKKRWRPKFTPRLGKRAADAN